MSSSYDYGPFQVYEITWESGHVEQIRAHQVSWPAKGDVLASVFTFGSGGGLTPEAQRRSRVQFHAEIDGRWTLQLSALEDDIRTIRNVATEAAAPIAPQVDGQT